MNKIVETIILSPRNDSHWNTCGFPSGRRAKPWQAFTHTHTSTHTSVRSYACIPYQIFCLTRGVLRNTTGGSVDGLSDGLSGPRITRLARYPGIYIDVCSSSNKNHKIEHWHLQNHACPLNTQQVQNQTRIPPSYLIQSILIAISLVTSSTISQPGISCDPYVSLPRVYNTASHMLTYSLNPTLKMKYRFDSPFSSLKYNTGAPEETIHRLFLRLGWKVCVTLTISSDSTTHDWSQFPADPL